MNKIFLLILVAFSIFFISCTKADELPPRIEEVENEDFSIPTTRLNTAEKDLLKAYQSEYDQIVSDRANRAKQD